MVAFAVKAEVSDRKAKTFSFTAQKTMYGGRHIAAGDTVFVFASENEGGQGLVARGVVTSVQAIAKKPGIAGKRRASASPSKGPRSRSDRWEALDVFLTSREFSAKEALESGLLSRFVPDNSLHATADTLVNELRSRDREVLLACKRYLQAVKQTPVGVRPAHALVEQTRFALKPR